MHQIFRPAPPSSYSAALLQDVRAAVVGYFPNCLFIELFGPLDIGMVGYFLTALHPQYFTQSN